MQERKSPWDYGLIPTPSKDRPHELQINVDLPTYIAMAMELSARIENRLALPATLLYISGSNYLAALLAAQIGIFDTRKIYLTDSPESVYIRPGSNIAVIANQNAVPTLVPFARTLDLLFQPQSLIVGVLVDCKGRPESQKADITIYEYEAQYKLRFPNLPEVFLNKD